MIPHTKPATASLAVLTAAVLSAAGVLSSPVRPTSALAAADNQPAASSSMMRAMPPQGLEADLNQQDKSFIKTAAQVNLLEIRLGKAADDQGRSQAVKDFGKRMVHDHQQLQTQLENLGDQVDADVPDDLDDAHQSQAQSLEKLKGDAFDKAFTQAMQDGHKQAMQAFEQEARLGANLRVMNWSREACALLQIHQKLAQNLGSGDADNGS